VKLRLGAVIGSTLYYFGGRSKTSASQTDNTWSSPLSHLTDPDNDFLTLDLSNSFSVSSPPLTGLTQPSSPPNGPPAISLGALWPSSDGKFLYQFAGEFSDSPPTPPTTELTWKYDLTAKSWASIPTGGDSVTRPAEGADCIAAGGTNGQGLGVYLAGHLDAYTVPGWSIQVAREYLSSMLLFDIVCPWKSN